MSNPNYERSVDNSCPHDGWYNGNPKLMILNGTYADYRPRLVGWVEKGKLKPADLENFDAQWKAIALEEKKRRRNKVIEDTTPKPLKLRDGKIEMVAKPSDNGLRLQDISPQLHKPLRPKMSFGAIANRPDPLALEEMSAKSQAMGAETGGGKGNSIPLFVPGAAMVPPLEIPTGKKPVAA